MAKLFFGAEAVTGTVTQDGPTLSDPNMDRFLDWVWYAYPQFQPDGVTPKPKTNANVADAIRDWGLGLWRGTKANVLRWERDEAAQAARDAIGDLEGI
jgi:hypothetical protein